MSRFNHYNRITTRGYIYRTVSIIVAAVTLVFFMPRGRQMNLDFKKGNPWKYGNVIARENFPILKADEVLQAEQDSLRQLYRPIFELNTEKGTLQAEAFLKYFDKELHATTPTAYRAYIASRLRHVYQTGILSSDDYNRLRTENISGIMVSVQNMGNTMALGDVFTPRSAYEYLVTSTDSTRFQRSILQRCNLSRFVEPNLTYDDTRSQSQFENIEKQLVRYSGQVQAGQKIIGQGEIVTDEKFNILRSMQAHMEEHKQSASERFSQMGGQLLYVLILLTCLVVFFNQFRSDYLQRFRTCMLISLLTLVFPLITYAVVKNSFLSVYLIPYCLTPIFLRVFLDSRTAFITHVVSILLSAICVSPANEFIVVQLVAGMVAIYGLRQLSERSELFRAVLLVTAASLLCHLCFELIRMSVVSTEAENYDYGTYIYIAMNGFLLLVSYLLLIPFERLFKFTSAVTLIELSNTNNEVLRRLSEEAPGTFQHSMQVANLAAEVANSLGAKSQLVRTGALYHDIGKLEAPVFYTENQNGKNPHDNLSYVKSAQIIISHVKNGLQLADKYQLPDVIRQFIATHHGTSKARYFYVKYKNENPLLEIDEKFFTYPGPNPTTIEQAILMMADSVEAASRSLPEYTEESIGALVNKIVDAQVSEGYFAHCPITFQDIATAKQVLIRKLMTIYHTRISYPELKN